MITAAKSAPRLITLILLTALSVLSINMFQPSLPNIAQEFEVDYALVNLSIGGYLAVTAIMQIVMGPLSDRYGRRLIILVGLAIFVLASIGCWLASDIWTFLIFRLLQGAIISGAALSRAVVRDMVPAKEAASLLGYVTMAMSLAPMLGPVLGGGLDQFFGWRANFLVFLVLGVVLFMLCWADLGETNKTPSETFIKQFRSYPDLFRSHQFWGHTSCMVFSVGAFFAFLGGVPYVTSTLFSLSPAMLGAYIGSVSLGYGFGSLISARYSVRYELTTMMIAGRIVACAGLAVGLYAVLAGYVNVITLFGATIFVGVGNGLTLPSSSSGVMSVRPELAGSASGLSGALIVGVGALFTSFTGMILTEENGAYMILTVMIISSLVSLAAALYVLWLDLQGNQKIA